MDLHAPRIEGAARDPPGWIAGRPAQPNTDYDEHLYGMRSVWGGSLELGPQRSPVIGVALAG